MGKEERMRLARQKSLGVYRERKRERLEKQKRIKQKMIELMEKTDMFLFKQMIDTEKERQRQYVEEIKKKFRGIV